MMGRNDGIIGHISKLVEMPQSEFLNGGVNAGGHSMHSGMGAILRQLTSGEERVVFTYHGRFFPELVSELLNKAEERSLAKADPVALRKRLFNVLVEGLENINRHTEEEFADSAGAVLLETPEGYMVLFGNTMPLIKAVVLEDRMQLLNMMDDTELKEHYLKLLSHNGRTERGGAGLGLFAIARKSTRPMWLHSIPLDERTAYGVLQLRVS